MFEELLNRIVWVFSFISFLTLAIFVALKLDGVLHWPWLLVLLPLWIFIFIGALAIGLVYAGWTDF